MDGKLRYAAICCVLGLCGLAVAADGGRVENASETKNAEYTPLPQEVSRKSLADILGFDPVEVDASRERIKPIQKPIQKPRPPKKQDAVSRYEAELLADRRVPYGVMRTLRGAQRSQNAPATQTTQSNNEKNGTVATSDAPKGALFVEINQDQDGHLPAVVTVETPPNEGSDGGKSNVAGSKNKESTNVDYPQRPVNFKDGAFNSNAYKNDEEVEAVISKRENETLELDDVEEFAQDADPRVRDEEDDALEEDAFEPPVADAEDSSVATLQDECYAALDPYASLFIAYEPTYDWTESILEYIDSILTSIEESPEQTRALVDELKRKTQEADEIKVKLEKADKLERASRDPWNGGEQPKLCARYTLSQRLELVETFKSALERRVFLWRHAADYFAARNRGELRESQELARPELELLLKTTRDVRSFFGDDANGKSWRASFDVDAVATEIEQALELPPTPSPSVAIQSHAGQSDSVGYLGKLAYSIPADSYLDQALEEETKANSDIEKERERRMTFLQDRINAIAYKIEKTPMTTEQRRVFQRPATATWANMILGLAGDQLNGMPLLIAFERYERIGGGHAGRALQQLALRMTTSQSEACRLYGRAIDVVYDNPNVKAYVSEALINRLLPVRDPEFEVVQETVLNNPVVGRRRVDTQVSIQLVPDPNRLLMSLTINGRMSANTSSAVMSAKLYNESYANYVGRKTLEWRDSGIVYSPASVNASSAARLNAVETDVDFMPIVGDLARGLTRTQYESRQGEIERETREKVIQQTRTRFDKEANERFDAVNARLRTGFFRNMSNLGLSLRTQRSRTTDDWLLASLRFGADYALGCQATEPPTLPGAFADIKVHESAINSFLTQLEFAGKTFTPRQALDYIADRLNKPNLKKVEIEESELSFTFAKSDPITTRFFEDRICLVLRFSNLSLGQKSWDDVETEIAYRPSTSEDGAPTFVRDGSIELFGPASVMEQIPIRAVFAKIFPAQKSLDLRAELLNRDERFAGLALGLCRVSRGWFAISVVKDANFRQELEKTWL